jgi:CBS domain-containing protein
MNWKVTMKKQISEISNKTHVDLKSIIKTPITVPPNTSILDARDILLRHKIGRLVVEFGKKPVGIITEKDIAKNVSVYNKKPIGKMLVSEIMTKPLITVFDDSKIKDCAKLMKENNISSVVVINRKNKLIGVVTKTDLVSTFLVKSSASFLVSKIMSKKLITVSPDASIFEVQSILFNNKISRVIVSKEKKPLGIITYRDFIPAKTFDLHKEFTDPQELDEVSQIPKINEFNVNRLSFLLTFSANDIMTKNPFVVNSDDAIYTAAILMIRHNISGLPVIRNKKLVGILTKSDIVNVLAES